MYIIADTHFGHANIVLFEPIRLTNIQIDGHIDHDEWLLENWNNTVSKEDTIIHLGDVAFKDSYKIAKKLNGNITLIVGNHDKKEHIRYYKTLGWNIIDKIILDIPQHHKIFNTLNKEFSKDELSHELLCCKVIDINNHRVMFSHFPVFDNNPYDKKYKKITNILDKIYTLTNCTLNIHGHTHSKKSNFKHSVNVSVECIGFKPKRLSDIISS